MEERDHPVRPWVLTGGILLVLLLATGVLFYSPLEVGSVTACPDDSEAVPPEETDDGPVEGGELCLVQHADGRAIVFGLAVRNGGPLPITVTGIEFDSAVREIMELTAVRTAPTDDPDMPRTPLEPFRLRPGQERYLEVQVVLRPCDGLRGNRLVTLTQLPVQTRFVMVDKTTHVPLTSQLGVLLGACR
jgi:hypothetical protein